MTGPLAGIKILDVTNVLMGPYATQQLGDMGAEVIKVESSVGDIIRYASPGRSKGMSGLFLNNNRNKRSLVLDLKQQQGLDVLLKLVADTDVLVSNMRPKAMQRLGLTYNELRPLNDDIIFVSCVGFGAGGPYDGKAAYDDLIQTMAGVPSLIARAYNEEPKYLPANFCDRVTGLKTVSAVLAALFHRERTGSGQAISVPMFETMVEFLMSDHLAGHTFDPPTGKMGYRRIVNANRRPYKTQDGYLSLLVYSDKEWAEFLELVGESELITQTPFLNMRTRSKYVVDVYGFVRKILAGRTTEQWVELLKPTDLAFAPVRELEELFSDEHLAAVGFFRSAEHPSEGAIRTTSVPEQWSESQPESHRHAPTLGEHNREILAELGYTGDQIEALIETGVTT